MKIKISNLDGFTLIELMIVVAIIGILASMAIPNYLSFQARTRQTEAKANLAAIFTAEMAYFTENGGFSDIFSDVPWSTTDNARYTYDLGSGSTEGHVPEWSPDSAADTPGASIIGFTCLAYGNIDSDNTIDTWQINDDKILINKKDDPRF